MGDTESRFEELFAELADLPREEQERLLEERCADAPELADRLRRMFVEDARGTHGVLAARTTEAVPETEEHVGPYRLVRVLGEGGMGVVHLAEQEEPIRRLVALKRILPGKHRKATAARFEAEMQILAQLDHPGIAKIFDAGTSDTGLPWFSMEYVAGAPLLEACDQARLDVRARIRVFLELCEAVQYAHQKGVVHRDLSPRNVLVEERDGRLHPKVIDFGIARVLSVSMGDKALTPPEERPIGTLVSMSPEQAQPSAWETDTRTDVYALGVVLYELLAGAPPFDLERLGQLDRAEARRVVCEELPPPASERVQQVGALLEGAANARRSTPQALAKSLDGDLDWILARAMQKSRIERYATVAELALDLRHYLHDEPVTAAPDLARYRFEKFLRRHRGSVAAMTTVFILLVAGIVGLALGLRSVERNRQAAELARARETRERREAEAMVQVIQHALFYGEGQARELGLVEMFRLVSDDARFLFLNEPEMEAAARYMIGRSFLALGEEGKAKAEFERAYELANSDAAEDALDLFAILEGLTQATRLVDGPAAARPWIQRSLEVGRLAMGDEAWFGPLEPMVRLAAGDEVPTDEALASLEIADQHLATADPNDPRLKILGRLFWEASEALRERAPADAERYEAALEENIRALVDEREVRFLSILISWARNDLEAGGDRIERADRFSKEVLLLSDGFLPPDHWLRAEAFHIHGLASLRFLESADGELRRQAEADAEASLLEARRCVAEVARPTHAHERSEQGLAQLATFLLEAGEEETDEFLRGSWERRQAQGELVEGWWPVTWPEIPAAFVQAAVDFLDDEVGEDDEQLARGLVRSGRAEDALAKLRGDAPATLWFRVLALLEMGRAGDAGTAFELAEAATLLTEGGVTPEIRGLRREAKVRITGAFGD